MDKYKDIIKNIVEYLTSEFDFDPIVTNLEVQDNINQGKNIDIAYTTVTDDNDVEHEFQASFDIFRNELYIEIDYILNRIIKVDDINDYLDFDYLTSLADLGNINN